MTKKVEDLKLHETMQIDVGGTVVDIMRVNGGYIYTNCFRGHGVFVPEEKIEIKSIEETTTEKALAEINGSMCFDNFINDECYDGKSDGEYWLTTEALFCRLSWIEDFIKDAEKKGISEPCEHLETIKYIGDLLSAMSEDNFKNN